MAETNIGSTRSASTRSSSTGSPTQTRSALEASPSGSQQNKPQQSGGGIVNRVKASATAQLTTQKDRGIDALGSVTQAVRSTTQKLRDERHDTIATYVDQAADQIETWSRQLREKDVNEILTDVHRLARRQPAAFIGSAFALGLIGARFLKSSRQRDEHDYARRGASRAVPAAPVRGRARRTIEVDRCPAAIPMPAAQQ